VPIIATLPGEFALGASLEANSGFLPRWGGCSVSTQKLASPPGFALSPAYPNPFNPVTTITLGVPHAAEVTVTVLDLLGRTVASLISGVTLSAGYHEIQWNGGNLASGSYLVRVEAGHLVLTQKVLLMR
jgi:hypothetical protein